MVGIEADSADEAIAKAQTLFDQGDLWQDSLATLLCGFALRQASEARKGLDINIYKTMFNAPTLQAVGLRYWLPGGETTVL